ncbi:MAG: hypothetical protein V5A62_13470 [Haloarculaceae archaeon]
MPLGESRLRSERIRTPGDLLLDDPEASHAYAWLYRYQPATVEDYVETVDVNERQARLAANRLEAHGLVEWTDAGYGVEAIHESVEGVHVTPGVAAVLAVQLENYAARGFVQRYGTRTLAEAVACWPLIEDGTIDSGRVGEILGIHEQSGIAATNFVRAVRDYLELDPHLDGIPTPDVGPAFP